MENVYIIETEKFSLLTEYPTDVQKRHVGSKKIVMSSSNKKNLKSLYKKDRNISEYLNENGELQVYCLTCLHRDEIKNNIKIGVWLCKDGKDGWKACNPHGVSSKYDHWINWEPRVDMQYFKEKDFKLD
jgi:hypothetical protein